MARKKSMAVRCPDCGAFLDCVERCDCERINAEHREAQSISRMRKRLAQNRRAIERAYEDYDFN